MRAGYQIVKKTPIEYPDYGPGNCLCCGKKRPEGRRKYCSDFCGWRYRLDTSEEMVMSWGQFRAFIIKRDSFTCQECNHTPEKTKWEYGDEVEYYDSDERLEVHHINPIHCGGEEFDENNCTTLCFDCHKKRHRFRKLEGSKIRQSTLFD